MCFIALACRAIGIVIALVISMTNNNHRGGNVIISNEKYTAKIGDSVKPDEWPIFSTLIKGDDYCDDSFPGCDFRLPSSRYEGYQLAVNVKVTGLPHDTGMWGRYKSRCRIEFVGDGEPSTFSGGWIYHD